MSVINYYDLGYSQVFIFQNYLINQIKDGVQVNLDHVEVLRKMIHENFQDRKMVYISNRNQSYSVDPLVYPQVARIHNLVGLAIVTSTIVNRTNAEFEKMFYNKEFGIFTTLEESITWAAGLISRAELKVE
jgi:hypothetical protein